MASLSEFETLDEEVKELLQNYKQKKSTAYEPCTLNNYRECLIGLHEELSLLNINYIFNPYADVAHKSLRPEALVNLINSIWTLLHIYKNTSEKANSLEEQNHVLDHNNKQLNGIVSKLKEKLCLEKNEAKACIASAQRVSDQSDEVYQNMRETRSKLTKLSKQKDSTEKALRNEITRLKLENDKLLDRVRNKSDSHVSCSDVCDSTLLKLKERDRKQRAVIAQLQSNNQDLLREVLAMKEALILSGLRDIKIKTDKK